MSTGSPASEETPQDARSGSPLKVALPIVVVLVILAGVTLLLVGKSSKPALPGNAAASKTFAFAGETLSPPQPAPALDTLRNYNGAPFNLGSQRGKAVFVTFLYTHCPDVCPLIASNLHNAYAQMTTAMRPHVAIVAVSVDPRGDKSGSVATFMKEHQLTGEGDYLIGSARPLAHVWSDWKVGSEQDTSNPELVNHSAIIYGIGANGKIYTIYPANFQPGQIVHDVPALLARSAQ